MLIVKYLSMMALTNRGVEICGLLIKCFVHIISYRDPDKNQNDTTVPKEMIVGHLSQNCVKGVFYLNTDGTTKKKKRGWKFIGLLKGY